VQLPEVLVVVGQKIFLKSMQRIDFAELEVTQRLLISCELTALSTYSGEAVGSIEFLVS
jgi:hypothetical protein